jgi:hypothetical protein
MATLATHVALLPPILREKYADSFWIGAANEILEHLAGEGFLKELTYRKGVIVKYKKWITLPSNFRQARGLYDPEDDTAEYPFEETDGKIMLTAHEILEETSPAAATTFTNTAVASIDVNIDGKAADDFANYLLVITAGSLTGNTYQISSNDASAAGVTRIYYTHSLSSALTISGTPQISAANLISPDYYIILKYKGSFTDLTATSDEIPIGNNYEKRVMKRGLMMLGYERLYGPGSEQNKLWEGKYADTIQRLRDEILTGGSNLHARSRRFAAYLDDSSLDTDEGDDEE